MRPATSAAAAAAVEDGAGTGGSDDDAAGAALAGACSAASAAARRRRRRPAAAAAASAAYEFERAQPATIRGRSSRIDELADGDEERREDGVEVRVAVVEEVVVVQWRPVTCQSRATSSS